MLGFGGTFSIESPAPYSPVAKSVIRDLGIDVSSYSRHLDNQVYASLGLKHKIFFDQETFGADTPGHQAFARARREHREDMA